MSSGDGVGEENSELLGLELGAFQRRVRDRGALPAFRLAPQSFLVIDRDAAPALDVMAVMQKAPPPERAAFIRNPRPRITEAIEDHLRKSGRLEGLSPEAEEQAIEAAAGPVFVETKEFSERVTGITVFKKKIMASLEGGTSWLPEVFVEKLSAALSALSGAQIRELRDRAQEAIAAGQPTITLGDLDIPARPEFVRLLDDRLGDGVEAAPEDKAAEKEDTRDSGPLVLDTVDNFESRQWAVTIQPRKALVAPEFTASHPNPAQGSSAG